MTARGETFGTVPARAGRMDRLRSRPSLLVAGGLVTLAITLVLAVGLGSVAVPLPDIVAILAHRFLGIDLGATWTPAAETIVVDIRLPRVLSAMVVGAGLAVAGATYQGLLRNPLADPYVLGTASGAALGAAVGVLVPVRLLVLQFGLVNALAFVGAVAAVWVVLALSRREPLAPMTSVLLTGYAIGSLLAAGLAMAMYLSGAQLRQIFAYLLGSFDGSSWERVSIALPIVLIASVAIGLRAKVLNGLLLGEETASHLGIDVPRERRILLLLATLITAAAVSISGLIGFVGLVAPHLVRLVVGPDARRVLPLSAILGAVLLTSADLGARLLSEIPVGVVTALLGAPFFLALLRRTRSGYEI